MQCSECKWFHGNEQAGECRRYPPAVLLVPLNNLISGRAELRPGGHFAPVRATAWCGEFTPRETH